MRRRRLSALQEARRRCPCSTSGCGMRIAWLGPEPSVSGGAHYAATQVIVGLSEIGVAVDAYVATSDLDARGPVDDLEGVRVVRELVRWRWNRWYSHTALSALTTSQVMRFRAQRRLVASLSKAHREQPYDVVYQFSQIESPWSRTYARCLPPVVVHPGVHAAGELKWHRKEAALSHRCEAVHVRLAVRTILIARTLVQRRRVRHVDALVAPSEVFAADIEHDYGIGRERMSVVAYPIDLERFAPQPDNARRDDASDHQAPIELLCVSRIALRKGVELIVGLSHRLTDLAGEVHIRVVGDRALFSNYLPLLSDLHPAIATYTGPASPTELVDIYHSSDALIQPSHYEPFALTVGEALASGLLVVASDQVGAAEKVDRTVCRVFPAGSLDALEQEVRALVAELRAGYQRSLSSRARAEAERLFDRRAVSTQLRGVFEALKTRPR